MTYQVRELYISNIFRIITISLCVYILATGNRVNVQIGRLSSQVEVLIDSQYRTRAEVKDVTKKMEVFDKRMIDLEKRMIRLEIELEKQ